MNSQINNISWTITTPLSTAHIISTDEQPVPSTLLNHKLSVRSGDTIAILYNHYTPIITEKITGSTLKSVLSSLERGLQKRVSPHDNDLREQIYSRISGFFRTKDRLRLINLYEKGRLKPIDLLGDHIFFEGGLKRGKGGVWTYGLGS